MTTTERPTTEAARVQMFDPLAVMVGEFARDFVAPEERIVAIDRLYRLLAETRSLPAEPTAPPVLDAGEAFIALRRALNDLPVWTGHPIAAVQRVAVEELIMDASASWRKAALARLAAEPDGEGT